MSVPVDGSPVVCSGRAVSAGDDSATAEVSGLGVGGGDSSSEAKASAGEATRRRLPPTVAANVDVILLRVLVNIVWLRRLGPHQTNCLGGRCGLAFGGRDVYRIG